jgi:hypothetical protein
VAPPLDSMQAELDAIDAEVAEMNQWVGEFWAEQYLKDPQRVRAFLASQGLELSFLPIPIEGLLGYNPGDAWDQGDLGVVQ